MQDTIKEWAKNVLTMFMSPLSVKSRKVGKIAVFDATSFEKTKNCSTFQNLAKDLAETFG